MRGPEFEHERLLKYARAFGVSEDPVSLAFWRPLLERLIRVADGEIIESLSDHATTHNVHLESMRREVERMEENARRAVLDHDCKFFTDVQDRSPRGKVATRH